VRRDHTSKRGREFRTQSNFAVAFVFEIEKLLDNFGAAFLLIHLGRLQRRTFPFDETVAARDLTPAAKNIIPPSTVIGEKIAETR